MSDLTATIDTHLAGYCEPDAEKRAQLLTRVWVTDGELFDPPLEGKGRDNIADLVDVVLHHYPDHTFRRTTAVDTHHDRARYGWELVGGDGTVAVTGTDFAELDADGKLTRIVGFFGELAPRD